MKGTITERSPSLNHMAGEFIFFFGGALWDEETKCYQAPLVKPAFALLDDIAEAVATSCHD